MMRLPPAPRALAVQLLREPDGAVAAVQGGLPYAERQEVTVRLPAGERYSLEVRDDGDDALLLFASDVGAIDATLGSSPLELTATVQLQPLDLQARFTRLAWSGGRVMAPGEAAEAEIAVIGAKLAVWTRSSDGSEGGLPWFSRYTDEEGFGLFFLPINSDEFWCNFTLGDTLLASQRLQALDWQGALPSAESLQPPTQPVDADRKLLCTGDLEEVRVSPRPAAGGSTTGGSFPPANSAGAYAPPTPCWWAKGTS
ncbi:hypothetical protein MNEG_15485 [Monoraphidium neglectum]|uniref:Uncharacterized protein n=1 Tax=Monoraphidium neglectum TaxID=145388 RepID=A0A0D2K8M7_9CHLO|nr:hypothetical protein MNEG_15485 [Monoraphidium neglectum]KIY92478.1 hypothetical protein MNEG_15485 [Monoraphidium neglectum]|eukprot:XP_013891498.1 hypothetical protein MNEG_15485 [Monoraphidium neglectum]